MSDSPRIRRLRNDLIALERLRAQSSVFEFQADGDPPHRYQVVFKGRSLHREHHKIKPLLTHRVEIKLGPSYPRSVPELRWLTPIHHPNISEIGLVCLGGFGAHWVPSIQLDELCAMLWDMARFQNYDIRSPYNRDAALWAAHQTAIPFPTDPRSIRDLREAQGRIDRAEAPAPALSPAEPAPPPKPPRAGSFFERARRLLASASAPRAVDQDQDQAQDQDQDQEVVILESELGPTGRDDDAEPSSSRGEDDILFLE